MTLEWVYASFAGQSQCKTTSHLHDLIARRFRLLHDLEAVISRLT